MPSDLWNEKLGDGGARKRVFFASDIAKTEDLDDRRGFSIQISIPGTILAKNISTPSNLTLNILSSRVWELNIFHFLSIRAQIIPPVN